MTDSNNTPQDAPDLSSLNDYTQSPLYQRLKQHLESVEGKCWDCHADLDEDNPDEYCDDCRPQPEDED